MLANPFVLWTQLAMKTGAMRVESAEVIGHRSGRIAAAGARPSARDRREFARMSQEKIDALFESVQAMTAQLTSMNAQFGLQVVRHFAAGTSALASLATSRSAPEALKRHHALLRTLGQPAMTASRWSGSSARLAHAGLAPIHARASANARRLRKR